MNYLFYTNPFCVRGEINFYNGAIEKKIIPQAKGLADLGNKVFIFTNEFSYNENRVDYKNLFFIRATQKDLSDQLFTLNNPEIDLYKNEGETSKILGRFVQEKILDEIDVIIAWETPSNFLREIFPKAILIHEMPGFISRPPFPELYTFDPIGLFNQSILSKFPELIRNSSIDNRASILLGKIRADLLGFVLEHKPYSRSDLDPLGRYKKILLLPLQVTDQYSFKADSPYHSQMALLLDVLNNLPLDIGLVVTQYNSGSASDKVLNEVVYSKLKQSYPNLIYNPSFDKLDHISQYLIPVVDAVITVSSSIGLQALLWKKPYIAPSYSHLGGVAPFNQINDYLEYGDNFCEDDFDRVLCWIFTYYQPIAKVLLEDGRFIDRWVKEYKREENLKSLPNYFDLVPDYLDNFFISSKVNRASELLRQKLGLSVVNETAENEFKKILKEKDFKLISFDIFDTLVDRVIEQPAHLFKLMESEVDILTDGRIPNFQTIRQTTERVLKAKLIEKKEKQEVTFDEIYSEIELCYHLPRGVIEKIKEIELKLELSFINKRAIGSRIFDIAFQSGRKVVLISDMYLPEYFIRRILKKCGYPEEVCLYLSSSVGKTKHEGGLFEFVQNSELIKFSDWLHVGDNPHGDVAVPKRFGIKTFLLKSAYQLANGNLRLNEIFKTDRKNRSIGESIIYGLIQKKFFDNPFKQISKNTMFDGNPYIFGYMGAGPMFFSFLHWVMQEAKRDKIQNLLFLSRDGKILWRMAKILFPENEGWPKVRYVFSSRRAARIASIRTLGDISSLVDSTLSTTTVGKFFEKKFGIVLDELDEILVKEIGFHNKEARITANDREMVRNLALKLSDKILDNSNKERKYLKDYYLSNGVDLDSNVAVVDIGYAATMQAAMAMITGKKDIGGYYYLTFESALAVLHKVGFIKGYAGNFVKPQIHPNLICRNGFLFETIFCSEDSSFVKFAESYEGRVEPVFDVNKGDERRQLIVEKIHAGSVQLAYDIKNNFSNYLNEMGMDVYSATRVLSEFILNPAGKDTGIFEGVVFDDGFSAGDLRYIVPPREKILRNRNIIKGAVWKKGAEVFSRRSDIFSVKINISSKEVELKENHGSNVAEKNKDGFLLKIEKMVFNFFLKNKKKKDKYFKNRELFFVDSKKFASIYWRLIGARIT